MRIGVYESCRPLPEEACRVGDERLLADADFAGPADFETEIGVLLRSPAGGRG
jgi:hydrogenase maturation protease